MKKHTIPVLLTTVIGFAMVSVGFYRMLPRSTERLAFDFACEATPYSCWGVDVPIVTKTRVMSPGHNGMFFGGNILWLNWNIDYETEPYDFAILVHEMTHYLQATVGGAVVGTPSRLHTCAIEEEAFAVSNAWLDLNGHRGLTRYDWNVDYQCPLREESLLTVYEEYLQGGID